VSDAKGQNANAGQLDYWNGKIGHGWVEYQAQLDGQLEPLGLEGIRVLNPTSGERILDIGCGCGQTTQALAEHVGSTGAVTGVDISAPMLEVANTVPVGKGACQPTYLELDAQTDEIGEGDYDALYSRFGVMFFSEPLAAFKNLHRALKSGGRMTFVCWRPFQENLFMRLAVEAARPFLPAPTPPDPTAPGPFAFADTDRVRNILSQAGFSQISFQPFDAAIGGASIDKTVELNLRVGPLTGAMMERPDLIPVVGDAVRSAISPYLTPKGVLMPAAVWIVSATKD